LVDNFILYPAIDLRNGQVVRLSEGDRLWQTTYDDEPRYWAERWQSEGAQWLHVVNLDGAFGEPTEGNLVALQQILEVGLKVQFGGGLRDEDSLSFAFEAGISRAVIGTAAVEKPSFVDWALKTYGSERIAVSIDARDGVVRVRGWEESAGLQAVELARSLQRRGLVWCNFTDVSRDGLQSGINVSATSALAEASGLNVVASGGAASLDDVCSARDAGLAGIIIGRALYESVFDVAEILDMLSSK